MPYFLDPNLLDEEHQQGAPQVQISGASPTTDPEGSGAQMSSEPRKDLNTGSHFQNLDKYLQTNQAQNFGGQVLGKVQGEISGAQDSQAQAGDKFRTQVATSDRTPTQEQISGAIANPTNADPKEFQSWTKQTYTGPKSLAEAPEAWSQYFSGVDKAQTSAKALGSEAGRFSLLDSYFGRPSYNFGEKSLDNLLVQGSGLGHETKKTQDQATQLRSQANEGAKALSGVAAERSGEVDRSRQGARAAIGIDDQGQVLTGDKAGALGKEYSAVDQELADARAGRTAAGEQTKRDLGTGVLTADELKSLGLSDGQDIYGLDLTQYLTPGADLTRDQVMAPDERARIQALSQLAGIDDTYAAGTQQDKGQDFSFDTNKFNADVGNQKSLFEAAMKSTPVSIQGFGNFPLAEAEQHLNEYLNLQRQGVELRPSEASYVAKAGPVIEKAKAALAAQYQSGRKVSSGGSGYVGAGQIRPDLRNQERG